MRVKTSLHQAGDDSFVIDFPALLLKILYFFLKFYFSGHAQRKRQDMTKLMSTSYAT